MKPSSKPSQAKPDLVPGAAVQSSCSVTNRRTHLLLKSFRSKSEASGLPYKKVVAVLSRDDFLLPIPMYDLDLRASQPMCLEKGSEIGTILTPMVNHDPSWMKLNKVQAASP